LRVIKKAGFMVVAAAAVACCTASVHAAIAQSDSAARLDAGSQRMMRSRDAAFAIRAAQGGLAEVQLGKLANQKASDPEIKAFGQKMVADHTQANEKLTAIARKQEITLPSSMDPKDQGVYNKLQKLTGVQFDRTYMKAMTKDHQRDIKQFQKEANKGKDPQIKSFAAETLPILQAHLQLAKSAKNL
jgi:putative membrane protein